jgi:MFS family permease
MLLLSSRVVEALGIGLMGVTAPATIAMWFPPDQQGTPMGIWATWVPISSVAVYNMAPALAASAGWQSVWWIGAAFALILMVLSGLLVRRPPAQGQDDVRGAQAPDLRAAFSNRNIWLMALAFACFNMALVPLGIYYPTFLSQVRGYSLGQAAFISSIATLVILFSAPAAGWISDRIGSRRLMFSLPFLFIAVSLLFPFHATGWQIIVLMFLQGLIGGAIPTGIFAAVSEVMQKPELAGLGLALVLIGQNLGQLLGPIWFGQIVEGSSWAQAGYFLIPFCLVGFISSWMVKVR